MNHATESKETSSNTTSPPADGVDLIKDALIKAGKNEEEISSVTTVDAAQTAVDQGRGKPGVLQQALLQKQLSLDHFGCLAASDQLTSGKAAETLKLSLEAIQNHVAAGTILGEDGKVSAALIDDLAKAGYWGLPIPEEWGGSGASKYFCGKAMIEMGSKGAEVVGGLLSIERLIGAAGPLIWKGTTEQKQEFLTAMAAGHVRSGFGGTEPSAGCNITSILTHGVDDGDDILVYGEKLFISNAWYGHLIALLIRYEDKLRVLLVPLPMQDSDEFNIVHYGIHALRQIHNKGLRFNGLRVPKKNLLPGDGLSIIFHDLDDGRFAVAATAIARMRRILASGLPWVYTRETFGEKLKERQYIRYLMALQAAYITSAEALVDWSASLIDEGYQGDVSSMIVKTRVTDWLRQTATELGMFMHGGRFVLHNHTIGDNLADDMVSSVYEGPNPMLGKAAIKAMVKPFGQEYLQPLMDNMKASGVNTQALRFGGFKQIMGTLRHLWSVKGGLFKNRGKLTRDVFKLMGFLRMLSKKSKPDVGTASVLKDLPKSFTGHMNFANKAWRVWRKNFILQVLKYQERLVDEDLIMLEEIYEPLTQITTMLVSIKAAQAAAKRGDAAAVAALNLTCLEMRVKLGGEKRTSVAYRKSVKEVSEHVLTGTFMPVQGVPTGAILQPYSVPAATAKTGKK